MDWIRRSIGEFGQQIGIIGLELSSDDKLQLDLEDGSSIGMINAPELPVPELVIYIAKPISYIQSARMRSFLQIADYRNTYIWPLQAAANRKSILIAARIPHRSVSLSAINECIKLLKGIAENQI